MTNHTLPSYAVGIMAYNEEATIARVIEAALAERSATADLLEIVVVSSACNDRTDDIVREIARHDSRVRLITEPERRGKIVADNLFFKNTDADLLVLCNADVIPEPGAIALLLAPLEDPEVGMVGARVYPRVSSGRDQGFFDFANQLLWDIHHRIVLAQPKMGETVAFRRFIDEIPEDLIGDEAFLEATARARGLSVLYVPEARVSAGCPTTAGEYFAVRRRNTCAHELLSMRTGHEVATLSAIPIVRMLGSMARAHVARVSQLGLSLASITTSARKAIWTLGVIAIEAAARIMGKLDARQQPQQHVNWRVARSARDRDGAAVR